MVINPEHVTSDGEDCTYFIDEKPVLFTGNETFAGSGAACWYHRYQATDDSLLRQNNLLSLFNKEQLIKPKEQKYIQELFRKGSYRNASIW